MPIFRTLLLLFAIGICVCVALYLLSGNRRYLRWAAAAFKLLVAAGLLFFAVLLLERLV